jgi:hypothetical protein
MFRDWKGGGYHLEGTGVTGERLLPLIVLLTLAYSSATLQGQRVQRKGVSAYVGRVKEAGRTVRRHSRFYLGLSGQSWLNFQGYCADEIAELMRLNRNKRKYYLQGLRAMELVLSAF